MFLKIKIFTLFYLVAVFMQTFSTNEASKNKPTSTLTSKESLPIYNQPYINGYPTGIYTNRVYYPQFNYPPNYPPYPVNNPNNVGGKYPNYYHNGNNQGIYNENWRPGTDGSNQEDYIHSLQTPYPQQQGGYPNDQYNNIPSGHYPNNDENQYPRIRPNQYTRNYPVNNYNNNGGDYNQENSNDQDHGNLPQEYIRYKDPIITKSISLDKQKSLQRTTSTPNPSHNATTVAETSIILSIPTTTTKTAILDKIVFKDE